MRAAHKNLHNWYAARGRQNLPWRHTGDAYAIWVSEIMLQQTQVKTVLERFYFPFLEKFPTVQALANAKEQDVLKAWEGLGYYTRARNLHKAAKMICENSGSRGPAAHGGASLRRQQPKQEALNKNSLPSTFEELLALPGIGKNTAYAIMAFAYKKPVAVMEANVKRIVARVFALKNPPDDVLWEKAASLLDKKNPFDFNQAMMDIGALLCTPKNPKCGECPLAIICEGKNNPEAYPEKKAKKKVPVRERRIVIFHDEKGRVYLEKRKGKFLAGLYGFKEYEVGSPITLGNKTIAEKNLRPLGAVTHTYSHFRLEADIFAVKHIATKGWHPATGVAKLPLSKADIKAFTLFKSAGLLGF